MDYFDLIIAPFYFFLIVGVFYIFLVNPSRDPLVKRYFMPGLLIKMTSAIIFGLIYQFYYQGGDSFVYFRDSLVITKGLLSEPLLVLKLFFIKAKTYDPTLEIYIQKLAFYKDPTSFFVAKIASVINLFTFSTYSCSALIFAIVSYSGSWALFKILCKMYPELHKSFFFATACAPSLVFWSSSIMKDTITLFALCWLIVAVYRLIVLREFMIKNTLIMFAACYILFTVKVYILICVLPALMIWCVVHYNTKIRNIIIRTILKPVLLIVAVVIGISGTSILVKSDTKYSFDKIVATSKVTADWIEKASSSSGGSTYNIGTLDFNPENFIPLFFKSVIVSLYRPFIWEVRNPIMLLSSLEALLYLYLTIVMFYKVGIFRLWPIVLGNPFVLFALIFTIAFAFAIGISTNNFGTLVRYKIPFIPLFLSALFIIIHEGRVKKLPRS